MEQKFIDILNSVKREIFKNPGADLIENNIIDSLDIINLVAKLEDAYGLDFDPDDIMPENFASAEALWLLLQRYQSEGL